MLPLYHETQQLFNAFTSHKIERLNVLLDDSDHLIIDVDINGDTLFLETVSEWEDYMQRRFALLGAMGADSQIEILDYHGEQSGTLGYSVLRFCHSVQIGQECINLFCRATIVWKCRNGQWREVRFHCTPERREVVRLEQ